MRLSFLSLACVFALAAAAHAALPPVFEDAALRGVQFVDASEGWAVGDEGVVWHTIDGGHTWDRQKTGTRASLRNVCFLTPFRGWVVGRSDTSAHAPGTGVILQTTDGGITWSEASGGLLPGLNTVRFFNELEGLVSGDSTPGLPGGVFHTRDGGASWRPLGGPLGAPWLAADFNDAKTGLLAGLWGQTASLTDGKLVPANASLSSGRGIRALKSSGKKAVAAGDGGLVLVNADYPGGTWSAVDLGIPKEARVGCDFHAAAMIGDKIWLAGRPGSVVYHSPDFGRTWQRAKTPTSVPLHALTMVNETTGWAAGELGTLLGTGDGGKTWSLLKAGGSRVAALFVGAAGKTIPVGCLPTLAMRDGYLAAAVQVMTADPLTAEPHKATEEFRLAAAMRAAGGAAGETIWSFPLPAHADGLSADQLLTMWDAAHAGKAREDLLRQMVLTIRMWRPDVLVTGSLNEANNPDSLIAAVCEEAFKRAADPASFPELIEILGLPAHAAVKLVGPCAPTKSRVIRFDAAEFDPALGDAPSTIAAGAVRLLGPTGDQPSHFKILAHRLTGEPAPDDLFAGCLLARGGMARRAAAAVTLNPEYVIQRRLATAARAEAEQFAAVKFARTDADFAAELPAFKELLRPLPDDLAASSVLALADGFAGRGQPTVARELYALVADAYPLQQESAAALRWLSRYHASGEALRRIETGELPFAQPQTFYAIKPSTPPAGVVQATFTEPLSNALGARFRSPEMGKKWVSYPLELDEKLFALAPGSGRDPAGHLSRYASRLRLGLNADAAKMLSDYHRGSISAAAGNPWFDAITSEVWLADRGTVAAPPKPLVVCRKTDIRPHLDGKLDDACWTGATPMPVAGDSRYPTTARFTFDEEFLYVAVTCLHPERETVEKAELRKRDADLGGHDRVEILLDIDRDYQTYYRLRIDHRGCVADDCSGDATWNPKWFVAVVPTTTGWTAEAAIPLEALTGTRPRNGYVWAANVVRIVPGKGVLAWSLPADADPRPEGMGLLEFRSR